MAKGYLVLENGAIFTGEFAGAPATVDGEAVFNTSMNGYQEIITDPSYAGQILTFTYPSIGNYGCGDYGFESERPAVRGLVVKELAQSPDHYQSRWTIADFLARYEIPCLTGVDTRAVTRVLRQYGTMGAVLTDELADRESAVLAASRGQSWLETDLVKSVSREDKAVYGTGPCKIVLLDFGVKQNIINSLADRGCQVVVMPAASSAEEVMAEGPQGLVLSNGPGDPAACKPAVEEIKKLLGRIPTFGICLGHQLLALALGGATYKLKFGHRGGNHTVKDLRTGLCLISSQNHGYAVAPASLPTDEVMISFINLNDGTVEGMIHKKLPIMSVQFHPEATPGPRDSAYLFDDFLKMIADQAYNGSIPGRSGTSS
ncbi:MAG: glutamine-hydrolyzing carbamoyl-phosphate synthase small subunit [Syntrophomonadaceae bacterium]|nr:glutamine-hydrolyzing carbamoyl-phosphate synthase small subunit [Syntrophomonadaceae bacterium]